MNNSAPSLYKNWANYDQREFSYSLANDLDRCGKYAELTRIQGLTKIVESAAFKFGQVVEASVVHHYQTGADPEAEFNNRWQYWADKVLEYGKYDANWNTLLIKGRSLMREFLRQKPSLPDLSKAIFSEKMVTKDWTPYSDLIYIADAYMKDRSLLLDIKTSHAKYDDDEESYPMEYPERRWVGMDPQLRVGALVSGIKKVAFLVFVKTKEPRIQFLEGVVSDEGVHEINEWLHDQHDKLIARRFYRRTGWRFPNTHCSGCDVFAECVGNQPLARATLKQRESKGFEEIF